METSAPRASAYVYLDIDTWEALPVEAFYLDPDTGRGIKRVGDIDFHRVPVAETAKQIKTWITIHNCVSDVYDAKAAAGNYDLPHVRVTTFRRKKV